MNYGPQAAFLPGTGVGVMAAQAAGFRVGWTILLAAIIVVAVMTPVALVRLRSGERWLAAKRPRTTASGRGTS